MEKKEKKSYHCVNATITALTVLNTTGAVEDNYTTEVTVLLTRRRIVKSSADICSLGALI